MPGGILARDCGAVAAAPDDAGQALITHQPIHRAPGHSMPPSAQVGGHLAPPIHALWRAHGSPQRVGEPGIDDRTRRRGRCSIIRCAADRIRARSPSVDSPTRSNSHSIASMVAVAQ